VKSARASLVLAVFLLAGCPDRQQPKAIATADGATQPLPIAPPPPPAPPPEGWGLVGVGSTFETVFKTHLENGAIPDSERTAVQTVVAVEPDGVRIRTESSQGGVAEPPTETKQLFRADAKDVDAKPAATTHESVTVKAGTFECDLATETDGGSTTKTWRTKQFPVPVKTEVAGNGVLSTSELVRVELKKP
jgi:hypothetical protein